MQRARVACATIRVVVLDWRELSGLSSGELQAALLAELDVVMAGHSYQEEDELLPRLPAPLRVMLVLSWLEFEVTQGSLAWNRRTRTACLPCVSERPSYVSSGWPPAGCAPIAAR